MLCVPTLESPLRNPVFLYKKIKLNKYILFYNVPYKLIAKNNIQLNDIHI